MTKDEILAITESDKEGCATLNRLVHEKLGLCWHDWLFIPASSKYQCGKCGNVTTAWVITRYSSGKNGPPQSPDYTHAIKAAWSIKEWLDKQPFIRYAGDETFGFRLADITKATMWASPLDRCKAFLVMDL